MCGIAGAVARLDALEGMAVRAQDAMRELAHRGPDDCGVENVPVGSRVVQLVHSRLSVIDLSSGGHQPMWSADRKRAIVFNGEIYNYLELRRELEQLGVVFRTRSDTEVLLASWTTWGSKVLTRLVGMFAFAVIDLEAERLTCVRDGFGIKPMYLAQAGQCFAFASEIAALLKMVPSADVVDDRQAFRYLEYGLYDDERATFFHGVRRLPPGHLVEVNLGDGTVSPPWRWWNPSVEERRDIGFPDAATEFRERFLANVAMHLRSDVPLGAALSGGLDSSALVSVMRHLEPGVDVHTFSYIADDPAASEESWADLVNDHVGAISHKIRIGADDLTADLDRVIRRQGEPFGSTSIYAQYRVFQAVAEAGITVTLDGQGADELLAGYSGYPAARIRSLIGGGDVAAAWAFGREWARWPGRSRRTLVKALAAGLGTDRRRSDLKRMVGVRPTWFSGDLSEYFPIVELDQGYDVPRDRKLVGALRASLTGQGLQALLRHGDRNSMTFSVESRVPFLTIDLAEFLLALPEDYLIGRDGGTKRLLRAALRGIVPDAALERRTKIGFEAPQHDWLRGNRELVFSSLEMCDRYPHLDRRQVTARVERFFEGDPRVSHASIWRLTNFLRWLAMRS